MCIRPENRSERAVSVILPHDARLLVVTSVLSSRTGSTWKSVTNPLDAGGGRVIGDGEWKSKSRFEYEVAHVGASSVSSYRTPPLDVVDDMVYRESCFRKMESVDAWAGDSETMPIGKRCHYLDVIGCIPVIVFHHHGDLIISDE